MLNRRPRHARLHKNQIECSRWSLAKKLLYCFSIKLAQNTYRFNWNSRCHNSFSTECCPGKPTCESVTEIEKASIHKLRLIRNTLNLNEVWLSSLLLLEWTGCLHREVLFSQGLWWLRKHWELIDPVLSMIVWNSNYVDHLEQHRHLKPRGRQSDSSRWVIFWAERPSTSFNLVLFYLGSLSRFQSRSQFSISRLIRQHP